MGDDVVEHGMCVKDTYIYNTTQVSIYFQVGVLWKGVLTDMSTRELGYEVLK